MLQCVVCCSVLQCGTVDSHNTSQCVTSTHTCNSSCSDETSALCVLLRVAELQFVAVCCSVLQCVAVCCSVLQSPAKAVDLPRPAPFAVLLHPPRAAPVCVCVCVCLYVCVCVCGCNGQRKEFLK